MEDASFSFREATLYRDSFLLRDFHHFRVCILNHFLSCDLNHFLQNARFPSASAKGSTTRPILP
jgi:hypothetical protein